MSVAVGYGLGGDDSKVIVIFRRGQVVDRFQPEPLFMSKKRNGLSVTVGDPLARSAIWRLIGTRTNDELYVKSGRGDANFKISLHQSGHWRINQDLDGPTPPRALSHDGRKEYERTLMRYFQPRPHPSIFHALTISVPGPSLLLRTPDGRRDDAQLWLPSPGRTRILDVSFFVVQPAPIAHLFQHDEGASTFIASRLLPSGAAVVLMSLDRAYTHEEKATVRDGTRHPAFPASYEIGSVRELSSLRAALFGEHDEGGFALIDTAAPQRALSSLYPLR